MDGVNKDSAELRPCLRKKSLIRNLGGEFPYSQEFANGKMTEIEHQQSENYQLTID